MKISGGKIPNTDLPHAKEEEGRLKEIKK